MNVHKKIAEIVKKEMAETLSNWDARVRSQLNKILADSQRSMIETQGRVNLVWNLMNVMIAVLQEKGLLTQEDLQRHGARLMAEAKENLRLAAEGVRVKSNTPIDQARDAVFGVRAAEEEKATEEEKGN